MKFLLLGFVAFVVSHSSPPIASAAKVFKYSTEGAPSTIDPVQSTNVYGSLVLRNICDTLYEYKYLARPYELKPNLATSLPKVSKDGLTYTIKIKKGVKYADDKAFPGGKGREVIAQDLVYSIQRNFDPKQRPQNAWLWRDRIAGLDAWKKAGSDYKKPIEGLKALDKYTLQIKLVKPYPQLTYTLAMTPACAIPHEAVKKYGREFASRPIGSGPYILKSFNSKKAILVRNPKYRKNTLNLKAEGYKESIHGKYGLKKLDGKTLPITNRVEIFFMKEQSARWNSLNKGNEIQYGAIPLEQADRVLKSKTPAILNPQFAKKFHYKSAPEFGLVYSNFNMDDPRIGYHKDPKQNEKNKALRCAIRKGFNWPQRVKRFYYGIGEAFPGMLPPGIDGYDASLSKDSIKYDPNGAKALLKKHGWTAKNLPVLEYGGVSSVRNKQFFEQFRGWMRKIGYPRNKIKYKAYATFGDYSQAMKKRKVMFHGLGWKIDYPDSENLLSLFYGPNGAPGANTANFNNAEYNKLYREATIMQPSKKRTAMYRQMNKILIDECTVVSGYSRTTIPLWHKNVHMYPDRDVLGGFFVKYVGVD